MFTAAVGMLHALQQSRVAQHPARGAPQRIHRLNTAPVNVMAILHAAAIAPNVFHAPRETGLALAHEHLAPLQAVGHHRSGGRNVLGRGMNRVAEFALQALLAALLHHARAGRVALMAIGVLGAVTLLLQHQQMVRVGEAACAFAVAVVHLHQIALRVVDVAHEALHGIAHALDCGQSHATVWTPVRIRTTRHFGP